MCSCSAFSRTHSKKTDHCCAFAQRSVGQIPRRPVTAVLPSERSKGQISRRPETAVLPPKPSVGQIPRRPVAAVLLLGVQWEKFQEERSLLCSCSAFSWTHSKKTCHCCALAQRSVGQIPRTPVSAVLLLSVQWDKFQEDRSLLCSCSAFSRTNSKNTVHCCAFAQRSVGHIPRRAVTAVLLLRVQSDKVQKDRSLLCSCSALSRTKSKKTNHCCAVAQRSVGQSPNRPITAVLLLSVQWDTF